MFGPNNSPSIHHREPAFETLYNELCENFHRAFNISKEYEVLVVTGSGTCALETVFASMEASIECEFTDGEFGNRLSLLANQYIYPGDIPLISLPLYETSISRLNDIPSKEDGLIFLDAVSAFPYYSIPEETDILITMGCNVVCPFIPSKHTIRKTKTPD